MNNNPVANAGNDLSICPGDSTILVAMGGVNYIWNNGQTNDSIIVSPIIETEFNVTVIDSTGCSSNDSVRVSIQTPFGNEQICLVTIDTLTGMNKIIWKKTPGFGTNSYNIYRLSPGNTYNYVNTVSFYDSPEFIDYGYNSSVTNNRYKLSVIDTCGNASAKSPYHQTIHLAVSQGMPASNFELAWDPYIDENDPMLPDEYFIYRGTTPSNMTILDSVPGTVTSYTDQNVFSTYYYSVRISKTCITTMLAYSNVVLNNLTGINLSGQTGIINISPNPASSFATLEIPNFYPSKTNIKILISDITGKSSRIIIDPVFDVTHNKAKFNLERGNLLPGMYFVEIYADKNYFGKLILE